MSKRHAKVRAVESTDNADSTGRQRQLKRDEALRKKLEQDFSKKKNTNSRTLVNKRIPGTVSALRPGQALTVRENLLVIEAAQLMAANRCDCVLVVNDEDQLSGIFTAKDIAFRVVAESLDAKVTPVYDIMTKNPMCVTSDTSATEALNLMVSKGFRHLPVCNENGDIFGLLDITKCLYTALEKIERAFGSSASLYDALQGVEKEWSSTPAQLSQYIETLREKMAFPNLESVLDGTPPAEVKYRTNVRDIAVMMKELHTTAVLVTKHHNLAGIFTSKDIVLRVIAAGLNPENCTVVRVMTPNPDTASPETTVVDALKLMNEGHYLNLPVLDNGVVIGMVDVLKLTYVTLEQMGSMTGHENESNNGDGPMWGRFWDSFGAIDQTDASSQLSDNSSRLQAKSSHISNTISPQPSSSLSQLKNYSDITPNESASMVNQGSSVVSGVTEIKDDRFTFKFTTASNKTHRVVCNPSYTELLETVRAKVLSEHGDDDVGHEEWLILSYLDDENDEVLISCDADVADAVHLAQKDGQNRVKLIVQDIKLATVDSEPAPVNQEEPMPAVAEKIVDTTTTTTASSKRAMSPSKPKSTPKSKASPLLLPVAIGFLGAVIAGVIIMSKVQKKSSES